MLAVLLTALSRCRRSESASASKIQAEKHVSHCVPLCPTFHFANNTCFSASTSSVAFKTQKEFNRLRLASLGIASPFVLPLPNASLPAAIRSKRHAQVLPMLLTQTLHLLPTHLTHIDSHRCFSMLFNDAHCFSMSP